MCGIAGFCDFNQLLSKENLKNMTDVLHHRGPDDSGYSYYSKHHDISVGIGHRRLSILDLSTHGHQPMKYDNLEIVYNGEIYNFVEIKTELLRFGYEFESESDTEVVLKAYHKWGVQAVNKFNGMFAMTIFDKLDNKLILIRDRAGVKPLYYYFKDGLFMFSSELKSFHANKYFQKEINLDVLALYFQLGYIPQPYSIFKHTHKLKAGYYMELDLKSRRIKEVKYWDVIDFYNMDKFEFNENNVIPETEEILKKAFNYRMIADVPVGVFLSGGYDSSVVTALLQKDRMQKLKTFTIGFKDEKYNEAHHAKKVANHLGTDHTEYYCSNQEALSIFPSIVDTYDEPFGDSSAIPTILVSKIAKKSVSVSLSADGADEIFGGYNKYMSTLEKQSRITSKLTKVGNFNLNRVARFLQHKGLIKDDSFENKLSKLLYKDSIEIQKLMPFFMSPISNEKLIKGYSYVNMTTSFDDVGMLNDNLDSLDKMLAIDYKTYMVDDVLQKVDRATMSVSLEGREPFLDKDIIEFVSRLPSDLKIKNGDKKWLLKQITHKYIPKKIMDRPKKGFGAPIEDWLRNDLREYVEEYFSEKYETVLDPIELVKIKKLFFLGRVNAQLVWNILIFQMWSNKWM